jgi:hypothetical protein
MKLLRQMLALAIWMAFYIPTSVLVLVVMTTVVAKNRRQVHAPNIAS